MKAAPKYNNGFKKWTVEVETDDGEKIPVGRTIDAGMQLFKISKWDTKEEAEEWIKSKGLVLSVEG